MATQQELPPSAASLSESMRDLGYSLPTAIADIVDNSIAADASNIDIFALSTTDVPSLTIIDNGNGMSQSELMTAMKHGSVSPKIERRENDLGRFGLGLKTASFSQCRELTVISRREGVFSAAQWDLDLIDREDAWLISVLDESELNAFDFVENLQANGTMVIWRKLDRLFEYLETEERDALVNEKLELVERHLSLVFHRFLSGDVKRQGKLTISINNNRVKAFDPFCRGNRATQVLPEEKVLVNGQQVSIQPYVLPHHSKLTQSEYDFYQSHSDFISNQGAYIYRNSRLMAWGDWFRMVPKGEATKLARVQIDFPNTLDESWTIDIKKSRAKPPFAVRNRLKQIISQITQRGIRVHKQRGQKLYNENHCPVWERYAEGGRTRYALNSEHPLISGFNARLADQESKVLGMIIEIISTSIPLEMIYADYAENPNGVSQEREVVDIDDKLKLIKELVDGQSYSADLFLSLTRELRMFDDHQLQVEEFIGREFND